MMLTSDGLSLDTLWCARGVRLLMRLCLLLSWIVAQWASFALKYTGPVGSANHHPADSTRQFSSKPHRTLMVTDQTVQELRLFTSAQPDTKGQSFVVLWYFMVVVCLYPMLTGQLLTKFHSAYVDDMGRHPLRL